MSTGTVIAIVVAVIVVAALAIGVLTAMRRRRLKQRFGPEYDRLVSERDSKLKAEAELKERERRVQNLNIRPLTESAQADYAGRWADIQEQFVDAPADAVVAAQVLVAAVMNERGYPTDHRDQVLADLSVEHASTLDHYRAAEEISANAASGTASTEDLRQATIHYRTLFRELLGGPANEAAGSVTADAVQPPVADDAQLADGRMADSRMTDGRVADDTQLADDRSAHDGLLADDRMAGDAELADDRMAGDAELADDRMAGDAELADDRAAGDAEPPDSRDPAAVEEPVSDGRTEIPAQRMPRS
jgi:Tfp pilus assembly protein PilX